MAAICGVLRWNGEVDALEATSGLIRGLTHRAPDGWGRHSEPGFAVAHGALHATRQAPRERQPVLLDNRWAISVDGRIDNRVDVAGALGLHAPGREGTCDATLFSLAWRRWGTDFWRHVIGDFALAAWDVESRELHLVRDRVGVRPLFYTQTPSLLAFASEPEALLTVPGVSTMLDDDRIAYYLAPAFTDDDPGATWYRDVRRIQPGQRLHADGQGRLTLSHYWRMSPQEPSTYSCPEEAVEAFREVFGKAVACRLRSPSPPGLMLSGGIDSAAILASATQHDGTQALVPLSVIHDTAYPGEAANIEQMLQRFDAPIRVSLPAFTNSPSFSRFSRDVLAGADGWSTTLLPRLVYRVAREAGIRVVLDGIDGDLVMRPSTGQEARLLLAGHPMAAWRGARANARAHTYLQGMHPLGILALDVARHLQPKWVGNIRQWMLARRSIERVFGAAIHPEFARKLQLPARHHSQLRRFGHQLRSGWQATLIHAWWSPGLTRAMEGFDAIASREGVEPRHPWADLRVLDFFLRLPVEYTVRDGWTKFVARSAFAPTLGNAVAWHSGKDHFGRFLHDAVLSCNRQAVQAALDHPDPWLEERVSPAYLLKLRRGLGGETSAMNAYAALRIGMLALWKARLSGGDSQAY